jgi:hypothetical protein
LGKRRRYTITEFGIQFLQLFPELIEEVVDGEIVTRPKLSDDGRRVVSVIVTDAKVYDRSHRRRNGYEIITLGEFRALLDFGLEGKNQWTDKADWTIAVRDSQEAEGCAVQRAVLPSVGLQSVTWAESDAQIYGALPIHLCLLA